MSKITIEALMEQAQIFASAWAMVDGPFDNGNQLAIANDEKENLQEYLEEFVESLAQPNLLEIAQGLLTWHRDKLNTIDKILNAPRDTEVRLGVDDDPLVLNGELLKGFRIGLALTRSWIEKFPLSLDTNSPSEEEA